MGTGSDSSESESEKKRKKKQGKKRSRSRRSPSRSSNSSSSVAEKKRSKKSKRSRRTRSRSSSVSSSSSVDKKKRRKKDSKKSKKKKKHKSGKSKTRNLLLSENEEKARKDAKKAAKIAAMFGYTNTENPFGDSNLTEQFVWDKKEKRDKDKKKVKLGKKELQRKRLEEITRARERRKEREAEQEAYEKQKEEEARMREKDMYENWEEKEEQFHLKQQRERQKIRIKQGREQPIDVIAKNLILFQEYEDKKKAAIDGYFEDDSTILGLEVPMEVDEPYKILESMRLRELEQVKKDIISNKQLELSSNTTRNNLDFWDALLTIVEDCIIREKRRESRDSNSSSSNRRFEHSGIHDKVDDDVQKMLYGKSKSELEDLLIEVRHKLKSGGPGIDVDYWQAVCVGAQVAVSKSIIDAKHASILKMRLALLKQQKKLKKEQKDEVTENDGEDEKKSQVVSALAKDEKESLEKLQRPKPPTSYHSLEALVTATGVDKSTVDVVAVEVDLDNRSRLRKRILLELAETHKRSIQHADQGLLGAKNIDALIKSQKDELEEDEEVMPDRDSIDLPHHIYSWNDRFKPRKPKYFNRVKTGYEWNKYNQTHYDTDNPPPKVVKGYKFNIFYPDLIDKTKVPYFALEPADSKEFIIIRFKAGPPYEDVAFKIINKEWAKQSQHGFKCIFERGILHLYFNFKRVFYRK